MSHRQAGNCLNSVLIFGEEVLGWDEAAGKRSFRPLQSPMCLLPEQQISQRVRVEVSSRELADDAVAAEPEDVITSISVTPTPVVPRILEARESLFFVVDGLHVPLV